MSNDSRYQLSNVREIAMASFKEKGCHRTVLCLESEGDSAGDRRFSCSCQTFKPENAPRGIVSRPFHGLLQNLNSGILQTHPMSLLSVVGVEKCVTSVCELLKDPILLGIANFVMNIQLECSTKDN